MAKLIRVLRKAMDSPFSPGNLPPVHSPMPRVNQMTSPAHPATPRMFSTFSGGGLVEEGLKGLAKPVAAVEYNPHIAAHYAKAHGNHVLNADVRDVDYHQFRDKVDYFHASPVCTRYSAANRQKGEADLDHETAKATARAIDHMQPKMFTLENVKAYANSDALKHITDALHRNGYSFDHGVYNAKDFGTPQSRERFLLRARRDGEPLPPKPEPTHGPGRAHPYAGFHDAIKDLVPTFKEDKLAPWQLERHGVKDATELLDKHYPDREGKGPQSLLVAGGSGFKGKIPTVRHDEPAFTVKSAGATSRTEPLRMVTRGEDGKAKVLRLSPRAMARLAGVGDHYPLPESGGLSQTILGNGVPPHLARAVLGPLVSGEGRG